MSLFTSHQNYMSRRQLSADEIRDISEVISRLPDHDKERYLNLLRLIWSQDQSVIRRRLPKLSQALTPGCWDDINPDAQYAVECLLQPNGPPTKTQEIWEHMEAIEELCSKVNSDFQNMPCTNSLPVLNVIKDYMSRIDIGCSGCAFTFDLLIAMLKGLLTMIKHQGTDEHIGELESLMKRFECVSKTSSFLAHEVAGLPKIVVDYRWEQQRYPGGSQGNTEVYDRNPRIVESLGSDAVDVVASSYYCGRLYQPANSLDRNRNDTCFCSKNEPNSWLCLCFKSNSVNLTGYSLTSYACGEGYDHPKSWVLEGSQDGRGWEIIDCQENSDALNGKSVTRYFPIRSTGRTSFRFVRIRQTAKNHLGNDYLTFSHFEVFGTISGGQAPIHNASQALGVDASAQVPVTGTYLYLYDADRPLNGIIKHLTCECGGNVDQKGAVNITSSSIADGNPPYNAADLGTSSSFVSANEANPFITYDFRTRSVNLTSYSIASSAAPKSWVLEGSNDQNSWTAIDHRDLNDETFTTRNFLVSPTPDAFRFVRLRLTGEDSLAISSLEFFGGLTEDQ